MIYHVCRGREFDFTEALWTQLIKEWQLAEYEVDYINRQQGVSCKSCGSNLRSIVLAKGRVISVDTQIPLAVRQAVEQSPFSDLITLIEGDSASAEVVDIMRGRIVDREKVFVFLDSNHSKDHVLRELNAYSSMVTPGSYIVATDGVMGRLADTPRGQKDWVANNPAAARESVKKYIGFTIQRPKTLLGDQ